MYTRIDLNPARRKQFHGHKHPWIFSGAIIKTEQPKEQIHGQLVSVFLENQFLAHGYFNHQSQIAIRLLSWQEDDQINQDFFEQKIRSAIQLRTANINQNLTSAYRLIFAESDFLPGFVLDKYNHTLILQIHTLGAENLKAIFIQALLKVYQEIFQEIPTAIIEKSDITSRTHEGLPKNHQEVLYGTKTEEEIISENGYKFCVNFPEGQKTGFFLDQRENRAAIQKYVHNLDILNLFSYTGGFSIYASAAKAKSVKSVDISKFATSLATKNFEINQLKGNHQEITADCFEYLEDLPDHSFDVIIVDPPAFIKSQKTQSDGIKGYITINSIALQKLKENGILISSSCSAALSDQDFLRMLNWSANSANCQLQIMEKKAQPVDHPLTPYFPEGNYLKFVICRKVKI